MITDAILVPVFEAVAYVMGLLPRGGSLPLPPLTPLWTVLAQVESLVPIMGPLYAGLGLLSAAVVFVTVRLVLVAWNLVWP